MGAQLEDGYTRFANELLEALLTARLSSRQWAVLIALARKTYGFNKKEDDIGLSQLAELTGLAKSHVSVTVRELEDRRIINRRQGKYGHVMGINKSHKTWVGVTKTVTAVTESVTVTGSVTGGYRIGTAGVTELVQGGVTESVTTKDNPTKDNQKTTPKECAPQAKRDSNVAVADRRSGQDRRIADRFEDFYAAYPRKKSRQHALKAFSKLNPDEQLLAEIIAGIGKIHVLSRIRRPG
jgi:phage replication O-like protein O